MLNHCPKLSVVIPTRERADTLIHTLKTVITQDYDNLEIIVSDNASADCTREIVAAIHDKRIKYTNTGKRIGMSENWEHGLSLVTGDYVMFLGDDDGLLPNACRDVAELIAITGTKAIIWKKPDYTWPSVIDLPNVLSLECRYGLIEMRGDILLKEIAAGRTSYGRLPIIYSGFVAMTAISEVKLQSTNFFQCVTPDVYSGIVLAHKLNTYLYSLRPFSINGGSQHSNGISQVAPGNKLAQKFFNEAGMDIDKDFPIISGAISSYVAEAFCQANKRMLVGANELNRERYYMNIYKELISKPSALKKSGLEALSSLELTKKLKEKVRNQLANMSNDNFDADFTYSACNEIQISQGDGMLKIDCRRFNVRNSFDACKLVGNIFGEYNMPSKIIKAGYPAYALLAIKRKFIPVFKNYILTL